MDTIARTKESRGNNVLKFTKIRTRFRVQFFFSFSHLLEIDALLSGAPATRDLARNSSERVLKLSSIETCYLYYYTYSLNFYFLFFFFFFDSKIIPLSLRLFSSKLFRENIKIIETYYPCYLFIYFKNHSSFVRKYFDSRRAGTRVLPNITMERGPTGWGGRKGKKGRN